MATQLDTTYCHRNDKKPKSNTKGFRREMFVSISSPDLTGQKSSGTANSKDKLNNSSLPQKQYYLMGCSFALHLFIKDRLCWCTQSMASWLFLKKYISGRMQSWTRHLKWQWFSKKTGGERKQTQCSRFPYCAADNCSLKTMGLNTWRVILGVIEQAE